MLEAFWKYGLENGSGLLPGLVALICFNRSASKKDALTFGSLGVMLAVLVSYRLGIVGRLEFVQEWVAIIELIVGMAFGAIVGTLVGHFVVSQGKRRTRQRGASGRVSRALDWLEVFRSEQSHVLLHMKDGRRIFGWPEGWPRDPAAGHFLLIDPLVQASGRIHALRPSAVAVLLPAIDVSWVQFMDDIQAEAFRQRAGVNRA